MSLNQALCLLLVITFKGVLSLQCPTQRDAEVLILGAGVAGVTAARILHDNGIRNIKILEANPQHIGGRIRNISFSGVQVEVGANWIHETPANLGTTRGSSVNPIWTLARDTSKCFKPGRELAGHYTDSAVYMDVSNGGGYSVVNVDSINSDFTSRFDDAHDSGNRGTVRQALTSAGWNPNTLLKTLVEYTGFDLSYTDTPDVSSMPLTASDGNTQFDENDYIVTDQRGYASLMRCISEPFQGKVSLGAVVTSIDWNNECVCADVVGQGRMCGNYGIITFSIGVLQDWIRNGRFNGTLSANKVTAINNSKMGLYLKLFITFPSVFWNMNTDYIFRTDSTRGYYQVIQPIGAALPGTPPMILMTVVGDQARRLSTLSKDNILNEIMGVLRMWYGNNIPNATDITYHNWYNDEYHRGMYTNNPTTLTLDQKRNLASPEGRLYFSGEGNSIHHVGSVHGAYCSGIDAATAILRSNGSTEDSSFLPACNPVSSSATTSDVYLMTITIFMIIVHFIL